MRNRFKVKITWQFIQQLNYMNEMISGNDGAHSTHSRIQLHTRIELQFDD